MTPEAPAFTPQRHASFLAAEYLSNFVPSGGGAVKFVVVDSDTCATEFGDHLAASCAATGFSHLAVDAVSTRIHLADELLFAITRQIDWVSLARAATRRAAVAAGFWPPPDGGSDARVDAASLATLHRVEPAELARDINRQLQADVKSDYGMTREFRIAMMRLCQAELGTGQVTETERDAVIAWLHGELRQISLLKSAGIFRRIGRHSARHLLFSLCHWIAVNGNAGTVIELDIRRLGFSRRPLPEERNGFYYTRSALLDAYELLRQLVDNTDDLARCVVVVIAAPEFVTDEARGVTAYQALKLRIHDEVRDRQRQNPFASLIRLTSSPAVEGVS